VNNGVHWVRPEVIYAKLIGQQRELLDRTDLDKRRQFQKVESALTVPVAVGRGQFENPENGTSTVGSWYQRTGVR
jgi:hypothetical protein